MLTDLQHLLLLFKMECSYERLLHESFLLLRTTERYNYIKLQLCNASLAHLSISYREQP